MKRSGLFKLRDKCVFNFIIFKINKKFSLILYVITCNVKKHFYKKLLSLTLTLLTRKVRMSKPSKQISSPNFNYCFIMSLEFTDYFSFMLCFNSYIMNIFYVSYNHLLIFKICQSHCTRLYLREFNKYFNNYWKNSKIIKNFFV